MNFTTDLSQLVKLGQDLVGAAVQSDVNIARAIDEVAPKILAEQQANVPVRTGKLRDSLGIDRKGPAEARIGAINKDPAGWRAHFIEDGTAHSAPHPFIRPAGTKFEAEFARAVLAGPFFKP
jgi:HK97 gp10 family phage protein